MESVLVELAKYLNEPIHIYIQSEKGAKSNLK